MNIFLFTLAWLMTTALAFGQGSTQSNPQREIGETKEAAAQALATFQKLGRQTSFKAMGFESADEMSAATLDEPMPVFMVELNDLRGYQAGSDPNKLLKPIDKVIYPVKTGAQVRSSIILQKSKEGWKASDFGGPNFARLVTRARDESVKATSLPLTAYFVVQAPALNAYFLGYRQDDKLMLVSLIDDPALNLRAGTALPAEQVFEDLSAVARKYNGLPM
jgi:hypothetical protein